MRVKVGLDTSSAAAAPRPSAMPFVKVVFPAPSSPIRSTTPAMGSSEASKRPTARVSSSEWVSNCRTKLIHCLGQKIQEIGGQHRLLAPFERTELTAAPM